MANQNSGKPKASSFPRIFWIVVVFEFFERGAYYGMMSFLSVYFTDQLLFSKESVGVIKATIQPILYFLPIVAGALADRFGYRRTLMVAFSLLGTGYFLTSQFTTYTAVFLSLVVMAVGAGTFKPIISGTIARVTDKSNSTQGFGIFYWSINLGAFLFPLILVPYMKQNIGWNWVIIASAICTIIMLIPTWLFYKEPAKPQTHSDLVRPNLIQTVAQAFEIIYSPIYLLSHTLCRMFQFKSNLALIGSALIGVMAGIFLYQRYFPIFFISLLIAVALLIIISLETYRDKLKDWYRWAIYLPFLGIIWLAPGLTMFGKIISTVISSTVLALFYINMNDRVRAIDNSRFLLLIFIYSGFWVLYFQMFDSVLWYVKDYVDASALNQSVNTFLGWFSIQINWKFDVEHVTVINAGTIILLQIFVSTLVKNTRALPTMISGILFATIGMAILSLSTSIWVFIIGIIIFSIGEMTAHPKFISYIGQTAPRDRVATFMGYIFLYGVIGSSIGSLLGANLYVYFVDQLHQPKILWLIFSGIGASTIVGLILYNRFLKPQEQSVD